MANTKITSHVIADNAITTAAIADDAITSAKLDTNIAIGGTLGVTGDANFDSNTLFVDASANNVGIGTSSPSSYFSTARNLVVGSGTGSNGMTIASASDGASRLFFADGTADNAQYDAFIVADHNEGGSLNFGAGAHGTARMTINSSGNVGIGTSSPTNSSGYNTLDIRGTNGGQLLVSRTGVDQDFFVYTNTSAANIGGLNDLAFKAGTTGSMATPNLYLKDGGNVGIGTSSPTEKLSVLGGHVSVGDSTGVNGTEFLLEGYRETYNGAKYGNTSIRTTYNTGSNASDMLFYTASGGTNTAERMRILSGGGITFNGDTAAANALDDYEEGTWSPGVNIGTVTAQTASYTKIGRIVHVVTRLSSISDTSGSQLVVTNLPYPTIGGNNNIGSGWGNFSQQNIHFYAPSSSTTAQAYYGGSNYLTTTYNSVSGANIIIKLTYETN